MAQFKCKACGSTLTVDGQVGVTSCKSCGLEQTLPITGDAARLEQYSLAYTTLQKKEYDQAVLLFKQLKEQDADNPEAYWGTALCRYGAIYGKSGIAELNRVQETPFAEQADYKMALQKADPQQKKIYEATAAQIDGLRVKILELAQKQAPVNVLLLCKEVDQNGNRTPDAALADTLYGALVKGGLRVFYPAKDLKEKPAVTHEAYAYAALKSMQVTMVVGTTKENFNAPEIRSIWFRALGDAVSKTPTCAVVPVYRGMAAAQLPKEFTGLRALDASKPETIQVIVRGVQKLVEMYLPKKQAASATVAQAPAEQAAATTAAAVAQASPMMQRAYHLLREGKWQNASEMANKVRTNDPKCYDAYIVLLLCSLKLKSIELLPTASVAIDNNQCYIKALECATPEQKEQLQAFAKTIAENLANAENERKYNAALSLIQAKKYEQAITALSAIAEYKNASELIAQCKETIENAPKEDLYRKSMAAASSKDANPAVWNKCIAALTSISGYKDADDQVKALHARIEKFEKDKKEAEERAKVQAEKARLDKIRKAEKTYVKRKRTRNLFAIASLLMLVLFVVYVGIGALSITVIVPNVRYNNATDAFASQDYAAAESILADLDSFKNSDKHIAAIQAIRVVDKCQQVGTNEKINSENFARAIRMLLVAGVPVDLSYQTEGGSLEQREYLSADDLLCDVAALENADGAKPALMPLAEQSNNFSYTSADQFKGIITPGRDGYTFVGWTIVSHSYDLEQDEPRFTLTIKANWASPANQYEITFNQGDLGSGLAPDKWPSSITYDIETPTFQLPVPKRTGYEFLGWSGPDLDKNTVSVSIPLGSFGHREYTAHWEAKQYTITYDPAGGEVSEPTKTVIYDKEYADLLIPTRKGYVFEGWYNEAGEPVEMTGVWQSDRDVTLTAQWSIVLYDIIYEVNGGENPSANPDRYTVEDTVTLQEPTRTGYTFLGWIYAGQETPAHNVVIEKGTVDSITFTAVWENNKYTVTLQANGGTVSSSVYTAEYDTSYTLPTPTRTGYSFDGWYQGNRKIASDGTWTETENITLSARWVPTQYDVVYELDGGTNASANPDTYTIEDTFTLADPVRSGYTFDGWTYEGQSTPVKNPGVAAGSIGDLVYTAHWTANEYSAYYDAAGGEVERPSDEIVFGQAYTMPIPERDGYSFVGWFDQDNNAYAISGTWTFAHDVHLTAHWNIIVYDVIYELNGGTNAVGNPANYTIEDSFTLADPTRTGYTFVGWTYEGQSTPVKNPTVEQGTTENLVFTAIWQANDYTVTFDTNGGELADTDLTVTFDAAYELPVPTRTGYTFAGWFDSSDEQVESGIWTTAADVTLTARWTANSYTVTYQDVSVEGDLAEPKQVTYVYNDGVTSDRTVTLVSGDTLEYPEVPTRSGYVFGGWYTDSELTDYYEFNQLLDSMTLYAKWISPNYSYISQIHVGNDTSVSLNGQTVRKYLFIPEVSGSYTFTTVGSIDTYGYIYNANMSQLETDDDDGNGNNFSITRNLVAGNVYFIGVRAYSNGYSGTVTLRVSGATMQSTATVPMPDFEYAPTGYFTTTVTFGQSFLKPNLEKTGYIFDGWKYGDELVTSEVWNIAGDVVLQPAWTASTHRIILYANGGTVDGVETGILPVAYDSYYSLPTPERVGYTFLGWYSGETEVEDGVWTGLEDISLLAHWEVNSYNVTFEDVGGSVDVTFNYNDDVTDDNTVTLAYGDTLEYPEIPTRDGYVFGGWYTDAEYMDRYSFTGRISEDLTLYAKWIDPSYDYNDIIKNGETKDAYVQGTNLVYYVFVPQVSGDVTFTYQSGNSNYFYAYVFNSGRGEISSTHSYGSPTSLNVYLTAGELYYVAIGHMYSDDYGELDISASEAAFVSSAQCGLIYSADQSISDTAVYDQGFTLPTPTRTGYTFRGWFYGDTQVTDGIWNIAQDVMLVAQWEANEYTVRLDANGGSVSEDSLTVAYDQEYTLPTPERTGYTFLGWFDNEGNEYESGTWNNLNGVSLTARWVANTYNVTLEDVADIEYDVTYVYNDDVTESLTVTLTAGQTLQYPEVPTRDGYVFGGWYTDEALTECYTFSGDITEDMTLYANWVIPSSDYIDEITYGETKSFHAISNNYYYYVFVPQVSDNVSFYFYSDYYVYGYLYNSDGSQLNSCSGYYSPSLSYNVTAGEVYYVALYSGYTRDVSIMIENFSSTATVPASYLDGDSVTLEVTYDQSFTLPTLTRPGYTFLGWFDEDDNEYESGTWNYTSDVTLTPGWQANTYNVWLDANGGSVSDSYLSVTYDEEFTLPTPERTGYTFEGWFDSEGNEYESGTWTGLESVSLTASWSANSYNVTLNGISDDTSANITYVYNDDVTEDVTVTLEFGEVLEYPEIPTRDGYMFAGWYTDEELTQHYFFSGAITEDMTLYAKWVAPEYSHNGQIFVDNDVSLWVNGNNRIYYVFIPEVSATYTFTSTSTFDTYGHLYDANLQQLAQNDDDGEGNNFKIEYYLNAGNVYYIAIRGYSDSHSGDAILSVSGSTMQSTATLSWVLDPDSSVTLPATYDQYFMLPTLEKPGYTFLGWFDESDIQYHTGTWYNTSDVTLTPQWQANSYTVWFDQDNDWNYENSQTATYDEEFTLPTPDERDGYTFDGWFDDNGNKYESGIWNYAGSFNVYLIARWTLIEYTISYDLAGGTNYSSNPDTYTVENSISLYAPTREGYTFLGWTYEGQDIPQENVYIAQGTIGNLSYTANWQVNSYDIWFDANGGDVDTTFATYTYDETYELPVPTRTGYTFEGWFNGDVEYESGPWKGTYSMTLSAVWTANTYDVILEDIEDVEFDVTYVYNDDVTESETLTLTPGQTLSYPDMPTRDGYLFAGWYTDAELTQRYTFSGNITEDLTLYAKWIVDTHDYETITHDGYTSFYASSNTYYYYTFVPQISGSVTFSFSSYVYGYLYDSELNQLRSASSSYYGSNFTYDMTAGEVYYVALYTSSNRSVSLSLSGTYPGSTAKVPVAYAAGESITLEAEYDQYFELPTPERTGYTFLGWFNEEGEQVYSSGWHLTSGMTLTASWEANQYSVTLDANGGEMSGETYFQVNYDDMLTLPTPERVGYTFLGWFDEAETEYESGTWTYLSDLNLTAMWSANDVDYVVNHYLENLNDDGYTLDSSLQLTGEADSVITPELGEYEGFVLPETQTVTILPDGTLVVDYYYTRVRITATLITNNGEGNQEVELKQTAELVLQDPVRAGCTFGGWFTDADLTEALELTEVPAEDIVLYAYWVGDSMPGDFIFSGEDELTVEEYIGESAEVSVPAAVGGKPVVAIAEGVFRNNETLTSVKIPESVTELPEGLFEGCTALRELVIPFAGIQSSGGYTEQNDGSYPWEINENGELISTNHNHSTTSTYVITATKAMTLTLRYKVVSENNFDWLTISHNETQLARISGVLDYSTQVVTLQAGDTLTFTYSKDGSQSTQDDCAFILISDAQSTGTFGQLFGQTEGDGLTAVVQGETTYYIPTTLTKVTVLGDSISAGAFENCIMLEEVHTPNAITIGGNAFKNCIALEKFNSDIVGTLIIPEGVTSIGEYAFRDVIQMTEVVVADSVNMIGVGAFRGMNLLETLTIPFVGQNATSNNSTNSVLGHIFGHNSTTETAGAIAQYYQGNTSYYYYYYIPATLRNVIVTNQEILPNGAFSNCDMLESVTLPENITSIGSYAFYLCTNLSRINSEQENTIDLPEGLLTIGSYAFCGMGQITTVIVPETVTTIGSSAFMGCDAITDITLPFVGYQNVNYSGSSYVFGYIFGNTGSGTTINQGYGYYSIPTSIRNVTITVQTFIPDYAFYNCSFIESITIPEDTTLIGSYAFAGCTTLGRLNSDVDGTFNIPDSVTEIRSDAFSGCAALENLMLGDSLSSIGSYAFNNCFNLQTVWVSEQSELTHIYDYAFAGCSALTRFDVIQDTTEEDTTEEETTEEDTTEEETTEEETTEEDTTEEETTEEETTEEETTEEETTEEEITEEETTEEETTEEETTEEETTEEDPEQEPEEPQFIINLPNGLTYIGSYAFQGVDQVTTLIVPETVTTINAGAFNGCNALVDVTLPFVGYSADSYSTFGYIFGTVGDGTYTVQNGTWYYIPTTIRNVTITVQTAIPDYAFQNCDFIESITIPEETTSIGSYAFYGCSDLVRLNSDVDGVFNIPTGVTTLSSYVFSGCVAMTEVTFGDVTLISDGAFSGCVALNKINSETEHTAVIPDSVNSIGQGAFRDCTEITDWTLPFVGSDRYASAYYAVFGHIFGFSYSYDEGATLQTNYGYYYYIPNTIKRVTITDQTAIPAYAFHNCSFIEEIYLPEDTVSIGNNAFQNCSSLKRLNSETDGMFVIPTQMTMINADTFDGCSAVTKVTGGENLTYIGDRAFRNCTSLVEITLGCELTAIRSHAFDGCIALSRINSDEDGTFDLPYGITSIGQYAFQNNAALTTLIVPVTVTYIDNGVFKGCENLTDVTIPFVGYDAASINEYATFGWIFGYENVQHDGTILQYENNSYGYYYYIPDSIRTVNVTNQYVLPAYAFRNCDFITEINLLTAADDEGHGADAFEGCDAEVNVIDPVIAPIWDGEEIATEFAGGTGTEEDPYIIFSGAQLAYLAQQVNNGENYEGVYFVLGGDIRLGDNAFTVIGQSSDTPFKGNLNGNGYVIRDLSIENDGVAVGLFGYMEGSIQNLGIVNATVIANRTSNQKVNAAVLAAYNSGSISNCYIKNGTVEADCGYETNAGGMVGHNAGTVTNCYADVDVAASSANLKAYAGGLVAINEGTISTSVAYGDVSSYGYGENNILSYNGGLVGENKTAGVIEDCYRVDTQILTRHGATGCSNELGTVATLLEIRDYISTVWDADVWHMDANYPHLFNNY